MAINRRLGSNVILLSFSSQPVIIIRLFALHARAMTGPSMKLNKAAIHHCNYTRTAHRHAQRRPGSHRYNCASPFIKKTLLAAPHLYFTFKVNYVLRRKAKNDWRPSFARNMSCGTSTQSSHSRLLHSMIYSATFTSIHSG